MGLQLIFFIVLAGAMEAVAEKDHVHFKIHVPEIIKHHMHTHTIFIHVHHPSKKKKLSAVRDEHEDVNIYNTYSQQTGYGGEYETAEEEENLDRHRMTTQYPNHGKSPIPFYDDYMNDIQSSNFNENDGKSEIDGDTKAYGYPYRHVSSNYQVTENMDETIGSHEKQNQEKRHKFTGETLHDHVYKDKIKSYYKNKIEKKSLHENLKNRKFPGAIYIKEFS